MKHALKLALASLLLLACTVVLTGCLVSEEDEFTMTLNPDGKSGSLTVVRYNVQSDEREPAKQKDDFNSLMRAWKSDDYLLEKTKEGVYVRDRDVVAKGGKLVWTETSLFADITTVFANDVAADTIRLKLDKDERIVSTNGVVVQIADTTKVLWPLKAGTCKVRVKHTDFQPTSDFMAEFRRRPKK